MEVRIYNDFTIYGDAPWGVVLEIKIPGGAWRLVSLMLLATDENGEVNRSVEGFIQQTSLPLTQGGMVATERGAVEAVLVGPLQLKFQAQRSGPGPWVTVFGRLITTIRTWESSALVQEGTLRLVEGDAGVGVS